LHGGRLVRSGRFEAEVVDDGPDDLHRLADCGVRRFLIGETLMRSPDVTEGVRALLARTADAA